MYKYINLKMYSFIPIQNLGYYLLSLTMSATNRVVATRKTKPYKTGLLIVLKTSALTAQ